MRKMNCRIFAATLLAVQIAVTTMPATALAAENDQVQETVQEQIEAPADESEEVVEIQTQEESAVEVSEETETAEETTTPEAEAATAEATENKEETKASENPEEGKSFDQTVIIDQVRIKVTAEEGAFEEGTKLIAARVPSTQLKQVENAVADARAKDELVISAYAFDIKIVTQDRRNLQPAAGKKVTVYFETEEAANNNLNAVVYHIVGSKDNISAKKLATTVNRTAKTAEAQTDGLSYYVVEFVSKSSADAYYVVEFVSKSSADANVPAKTETTENTNTTGKTDLTTEEKNTKTETVMPDAKDTSKAGTETTAVKKETETETKTSEVKKEKKSEDNKKKESVKKDKTNAKKSPKTGDTSNMVIWITTNLLAVGGIVILLLARRRLR